MTITKTITFTLEKDIIEIRQGLDGLYNAEIIFRHMSHTRDEHLSPQYWADCQSEEDYKLYGISIIHDLVLVNKIGLYVYLGLFSPKFRKSLFLSEQLHEMGEVEMATEVMELCAKEEIIQRPVVENIREEMSPRMLRALALLQSM